MRDDMDQALLTNPGYPPGFNRLDLEDHWDIDEWDVDDEYALPADDSLEID